MKRKQIILVLSAHCDDESLGAGGTIARMSEEGAIVHVVSLSSCAESLPPEYHETTLIEESHEATGVLGACTNDVRGFKVRYMERDRQDILEYFVDLNRELSPDLVICPATTDRHQDHKSVAHEAERAFKCTIWGYELAHNTTDSRARHFVRLEERHLAKKIEAVSRYTSQSTRPYMNPDTIRSVAVTSGLRAGCPYSEAFEIIRSVL